MSQDEFGPAHPNYLVDAKDQGFTAPHLTQPEPINHNELKRLLHECFIDIFLLFQYPEADLESVRRAVMRRIDDAILDGDDS